MEISETIVHKTMQLEEELKALGLWRKDSPSWIHNYQPGNGTSITDFTEWLQFIFIPNHINKQEGISARQKKLLVPMALRYFGADVQKGKVLQILIEIDSLL